jgi:GT2 family glycosyltransferase/SAM-dependent methyltransferase
MGELFKRTALDGPLEWTGERLTTNVHGQVEVEHLHRYFLARQMCRSLDVLDIASGEGYGSAFLAQTARSVVGVEIDPTSVYHARQAYRADNLRFEEGRAQDIPLPDASVDCVVSFETVEHLYEQELFVSEIKRVLRPGGFVLMSSPNRDVYSPLGQRPNPHHVRELTREEFFRLLRRRFDNVQFLGQRPIIGSLIVGEDDAPQAVMSFERRDETIFEANEGVGRVLYWVCMASDSALHTAPDSFYFERGGLDDILVELPRVKAELARVSQDSAASERELDLAVSTLKRAEEAHRHAVQEVEEVKAELARFSQDSAARERELDLAVSTLKRAEEAHRHAVQEVEEVKEALMVARDTLLTREQALVTAEKERQEALQCIERLRAELGITKAAANVYQEASDVSKEYLAHYESLRTVIDRTNASRAQVRAMIAKFSIIAICARLAKLQVRVAALLRHPRKRQKRRTYRQERLAALRDFFEGPPLVAIGNASSHMLPASTAESANSPHRMPAAARDYVRNRFGGGWVAIFENLFDIVDRYRNQGDAFSQSKDCKTLADRVRHLATKCPPVIPDVTIVIPVFNNLHLTLTCIASILESRDGWNCEILIGDDRSTDGSEELLAGIGHPVQVVRHPDNLGFLQNCNVTAAAARGRHLVFLNNDTLVLPGWLDALMRVLDNEPMVGMVGSKLLNGDGSLQEAGGIMWRDGSAWNYGRNHDPTLPEYNYLKETDYVSGASIAMPVDVWKKLGGFDDHFAPAYCEDSDIAFRVRELGLKVIYQPMSEVIHHEGQSHGRDTGSNIKAYQVVNQKKFLERWHARLHADNFPNGTELFLARDRSAGKRHVVVIDHYVPQPDCDAGSRSMMTFLRAMIDEGCQVTFWPDNLYFDPTYTRTLQEMGVEVIYGPDYVGAFGKWLAERQRHIDFVFLSRPHVAKNYIDHISKYRHIRKLYYGHDLHYSRMQIEAQTSKSGSLLKKAETMKVLEKSIWERMDVVLYPSQEEADEVKRIAPQVDARYLLPYAFDCFTRRSVQPDSPILLFVGGFAHTPNIDAAVWFATEILPSIWETRPDVQLVIAGSNPHEAVRSLEAPGITVTGSISEEELAQWYRRAQVAVVPLRIGAGVKLKVVEAMQKGVPVVTTSVGAQGLPALDSHAAVHDNPVGFAAAVLQLLNDPDYALGMSARQSDYVESRFTLAALRQSLSPLMSGSSGERQD